jgi:hypothetical protein
MPYNVIDQGPVERCISYCETATRALETAQHWLSSGVRGFRVMSVEGAEIPLDRLSLLARLEQRAESDRRFRRR